MSARYDDCLPTETRVGRCGQQGAALIMAILALALMVEIAALAVGDYGATLELLVGRQDLAQSRWLARGAVDWAKNVLSEDLRVTQDVDHAGELWGTRIAPTPVEDGEVAGEISDQSGYFNLNSLVVNGRVDAGQVARYRRLLELIGFSPADAIQLAATLVDWLDSDDTPTAGGAEAAWYAAQQAGYRPANGMLADTDELRLIRGYSSDVVERVRRVAVALPDPGARINVNFAPAEVLSATIDIGSRYLSLEDARTIIANRSGRPFTKLEDFRKLLPVGANVGSFVTGSRYFLVGGRAKYGLAVTRMQVLLDRKSNGELNMVWQKIL